MGNTFYFEFEPELIRTLQRLLNPVTKALAVFISYFGDELVLVAVLGFVYWCYDKKFGKYLSINVSVGVVLFPMLKNVALRRRPYMDFKDIQCVRPATTKADPMDIAAQGCSFPSGHSVNSMNLFGSLYLYARNNKILKVLAFVMPLLVGLSRIFLGVHYPTDVLAGYLIGAVVMFLVSWLQKFEKYRYALYAGLVVVCIPGFFFCRTNDFYNGVGILIGLIIAFIFEEKCVKFEMPNSVLYKVLRLVIGFGLYMAVNTLLKKIFPSSDDMAGYVLRSLRCMISTFFMFGLYPMTFRFMKGRAR